MRMNAVAVIKELKSLGMPEKAKASAWFFKTGEGQYGYGDVFYGVTVPESRAIAGKYHSLPLSEIEKLLEHKVHECRLTALHILVDQYARADEKERGRIVKFYLAHIHRINNWDLVDTSAHKILGAYLVGRDRRILYKLAKSKNLWERRISIVATFVFIARDDFADSLALIELLLGDKHHLMHKAMGWVLREVGKRSYETEIAFLEKHLPHLPRTTLRYAIERFSESERKHFMRR